MGLYIGTSIIGEQLLFRRNEPTDYVEVNIGFLDGRPPNRRYGYLSLCRVYDFGDRPIISKQRGQFFYGGVTSFLITPEENAQPEWGLVADWFEEGWDWTVETLQWNGPDGQ